VCVCEEIILSSGYLTFSFNISTGLCDIINKEFLSTITDLAWNETVAYAFTRFEQLPCEAGSYCVGGVRNRCPGGLAGAFPLETRPECSGVCVAGFYCPEGSTSVYQYPCGKYVELHTSPISIIIVVYSASVYCPAGSAYPLLSSAGFFTSASPATSPSVSAGSTGTETVCSAGYFCVGGVQTPCPAGTFSNAGASSCDGKCAAGKYAVPSNDMMIVHLFCDLLSRRLLLPFWFLVRHF
jgi:hypothetical protein